MLKFFPGIVLVQIITVGLVLIFPVDPVQSAIWSWLRLAAPQDLHYINGADTLPPPLPPEQERAALDALVSRHASASVRE